MDKQLHEVSWKMTGTIKVMATDEDEAEEICNALPIDDVLDRSIDIDWETRYISKASDK